MAKLVTLKRQSGEAVYPVTVTAAVMDSNGNPAEVVFAKKNDSVSSKSSDQGVEVELGGTLASPTVKVNVTSSGITSDNNSVAIASEVFKYAAKNEVFKGAKAATSTSVAEAGKVGLVPAPASGAITKYLRSDGNWSDVDAAKLGGIRPIGFMRVKASYANTIHQSANDMTDSGSYRLESKNEGLPLDSNFGNVLVVRGLNGVAYGDTLAQMFFPYVKNEVYLRTGSTGTGSSSFTNRDWSRFVLGDDTIKTTYDTDKGVKVELSGTFDEPKIDVTTTFGDVKISNSSNAVSGETIAKSVPLLNGSNGIPIPSNSDLNSLAFCEELGTYICSSHAFANSLTNAPSGLSAFSLYVYAPLGMSSLTSPWAYRVRKITDINGREWIQEIFSDGDKVVQYQPWHRILREDTTFTRATASTVNGTQVVNAGTGGAVPAPKKLEDNDKFLKGNGTWSAIPTSSVGSGITLPATGNAVHEALTGTTYINTIGTDFIDNLFTAKG
jgi:hypothetical protein